MRRNFVKLVKLINAEKNMIILKISEIDICREKYLMKEK